jgi:transcriptional regulator with XRE-family HTH domain
VYPQTLGEHLKRKRLQSNQLQREVAARLGATHAAYLHWETGQTEPFVRYYPKIIEFLEYVPWTEATSLAEELLQFRRLNGWSIRQASAALNVDQGTWGRWEEGMEPKHGSHKQLLAELFQK